MNKRLINILFLSIIFFQSDAWKISQQQLDAVLQLRSKSDTVEGWQPKELALTQDDGNRELYLRLLRDGLPEGRKARVSIIGAGISGLLSGCLLKRAGYQVTVFEASNRAGKNDDLRARHVFGVMGRIWQYAISCQPLHCFYVVETFQPFSN